MLIKYKVKGFKTFNEEIEFSLKANQKILNKDYVFKYQDMEILKSAIMYGPNNTGKSAFVESLRFLKTIIKNGKIDDNFSASVDKNIFIDDDRISFNIEFIENSQDYNYSIIFNEAKEIIAESLLVNNQTIFDIHKNNNIEEINHVLEMFKDYKNNLIISILPGKFKKYTDDFNLFFDKLVIIDKYFSFKDVLEEVNDLTEKEKSKFSNILKSADISLENVYINQNYPEDYKELRLFSTYKMKEQEKSVPSILFDSQGTQVFMYYILKILKLQKFGGILVIDEIDRSLHTLLTKNIIALFNSIENKNMQLITTSHDLLLLDCLYLFRKDQVWFTYKDKEQVYLYSLDNFKANKDKQIRNKTMESYLKGLFGALPHPNIEEYFYDE